MQNNPLNLDYEQAGFKENFGCSREQFLVAGVDEVGRGPLAGPVIACAVMLAPFSFKPDAHWQESLAMVTDSKRLSAIKRKRLLPALNRLCYAFGAASVQEIDRINILQASLLAMRRAVNRLPHSPHFILIDGNQKLPYPAGIPAPSMQTLIKGDQKSFTIGAASILAKECRDQLMQTLDQRYPAYGFARNAGYGVKLHLEGLAKLGPSPHHRNSFAPVKAAYNEV